MAKYDVNYSTEEKLQDQGSAFVQKIKPSYSAPKGKVEEALLKAKKEHDKNKYLIAIIMFLAAAILFRFLK